MKKITMRLMTIAAVGLLLTGCGSNVSSSNVTLGTIMFNGKSYVPLESFITKVGKKIGSQNRAVFFQIPGDDPNKEIAVKTDNGEYQKLMRIDLWENTEQGKKFIKLIPNLNKMHIIITLVQRML
jgi:hypothetical protein